jgi:nitronate monooxygenase
MVITVVLERTLKLKGIEPRYPIVQGGMGVGISLYELASAVGKEGGIGTVSSAALDQLVARRLKRDRMDLVEATAIEIADTKKDADVAAINIMCALFSSYNKSVEGAIKGGVDVIISGAGLPTSLPSLVEKITGKKDHGINLVPIVSSDRALEIICKKWSAQGYRPDAVVLEGPKAGGHLGWNYNQVKDAGENFLREYDLFEKLFGPVMDVAAKYPNDFGPIPVIVAGGIYSHEDIVDALKRGAAGVQMGTRFAVTDESGGSAVFKNSILNSKKEDIVVATEDWGSPCKLPFRYIKTSPLALKERKGNSFCICTTLMKSAGIDNSDKLGAQYPPKCPEQYVLLPGKVCPANGAVDYTELATCGSEGYRVDKIVSTKELMKELVGN